LLCWQRPTARERPIDLYYDIGGGYHATTQPGEEDVSFDVGLGELLILGQISSFIGKVVRFYRPGVRFSLVIDNMCALLINDIPLDNTLEYCARLRDLIRRVRMETVVELLVESEHVTVADFDGFRTRAAHRQPHADLSRKEHDNVERFLGRPCDEGEAVQRTSKYEEVIEASEHLMAPFIRGVHMTQRATETTVCLVVSGRRLPIQCGHVALTRNSKDKLHPILLTSSNRNEYACRALPPRPPRLGHPLRHVCRADQTPGDRPVSHSGTPTHEGHALRLRFRWPDDEAPESDNFFVGVWHPSRTIEVEWRAASSPESVFRHGPNWFLASASSPLHPTGTGLLHSAPDRSIAVAFRGYVLPRLQSYSSSEEVLDYWGRDLFAEHNGVFSAAVVGRDGRTLTLMTDACGMGALYYTSLGDATVFSTNPRYLVTEEARPDLLAWRCLLQTSWIVGNHSLSDDVRRVPLRPGTLRVSGRRPSVPWFDFSRLPGGTRPVGPTAVAEVEETFQQAMSRLLQLQAGSTVLPLSSGFDSRRILAAMIKRGCGLPGPHVSRVPEGPSGS
jgi:hypothetical protein